MGKLATLIEAPIKGAFGNNVNVGDTVMVVTTGYSHRVKVEKGTYKGYIEGVNGQRARIETECTGYKRYWNDTGEEFKYRGTREKGLPSHYVAYFKTLEEQTHLSEYKYTRKTTLNLNRIATLKD